MKELSDPLWLDIWDKLAAKAKSQVSWKLKNQVRTATTDLIRARLDPAIDSVWREFNILVINDENS